MINPYQTAAAVLASLASLCGAQSVEVRISHDDPDGFVEPGQVVRITARIHRDFGAYYAGMGGDVVPTPDRGVASHVASPFTPSAVTQLGTPVGGGVYGFAVSNPNPPFFGGIQFPPWTLTEFDMLWFDWTAPSVNGPVTFAFRSATSLPGVGVYATPQTTTITWVTPAIIGATLIVVPAPPCGLALVAPVLGRRRRR